MAPHSGSLSLVIAQAEAGAPCLPLGKAALRLLRTALGRVELVLVYSLPSS